MGARIASRMFPVIGAALFLATGCKGFAPSQYRNIRQYSRVEVAALRDAVDGAAETLPPPKPAGPNASPDAAERADYAACRHERTVARLRGAVRLVVAYHDALWVVAKPGEHARRGKHWRAARDSLAEQSESYIELLSDRDHEGKLLYPSEHEGVRELKLAIEADYLETCCRHVWKRREAMKRLLTLWGPALDQVVMDVSHELRDSRSNPEIRQALVALSNTYEELFNRTRGRRYLDRFKATMTTLDELEKALNRL